ncbi:T9SS type A sorting domain-containing protein [Panacibacter ginsenosidivorans]|uniref:T9SS type A sorting domain-containing protein n=1 Tax=Panacibacter ginsenosidivorans TaxID=1813871 RepID=A0A5B8V3X6_9BACT|nr:T9SS type A sorting domain-containing protein [Panacibacter ginsenosidivorans]QEC66084.1 T9SS type A sorting domain-containing protein [Panacibacter ginsenosidivorans]
MKMKFFLCILLCAYIDNTTFAQIWTNTITGTNPNLNDPYITGQTVISNLTVSGIGRGTGIAGVNGNDQYNAKSWASTTISANKYFYFTLTADPGYVINFSNFVYLSQVSGNGPTMFSFRSSADNYASDIGTPNTSGTTIDLSGTAYQNLTSITFRFFAWGASVGAGTFSIDEFSFYGTVAIPGFTSLNTDYFRTASSGNWSSSSVWESSHDGVNFYGATLVPDQNATSINIRSGHTVTLDASATARLLTISSGGTLIHTNGISLGISDDGTNTNDFIINGTYVLKGTQPAITSPTKSQVNGLVRVDDNINGESDDFARNSQITFRSASVFQWNTTQLFETGTSGIMTYMPSSSVGAIFRVSANLDQVGSSGTNSILFNSKFEVATGYTVKFVRNGFKYFRDGLGGGGTIVHQSITGGAIANCGLFQITGTNAVIDGTITIDIEHTTPTTDFEISGTATISGSPIINIGKPVTNENDATFVISGTVINNSSIPINLANGNLYVSGHISGTGTFTASSTLTKITIAKSTSGTAGVLNFTSGANTVKDFIMGLTTTFPQSSPTSRIAIGTPLTISDSLTLTLGIIVTGNNLLTWNNSGGKLVSPTGTNYANSFIATCDQSGNALTVTGVDPFATSPFTGDAGFRINNVKGSSLVTFPVGPDLSRPNRIGINPGNLTGTDITVIVGKGDILYTPQPRVNRIWYVHASNQANVAESGIRLYFTKYNWSTSLFGVNQDEIEYGFISGSVYVGRKDYSSPGNYLSHRSTPRDVGSLDETEGYADYQLNTGIGSFVPGYYKFSAGNFGTIILPVTLTNLKAYQQGNNIAINWSALNELNVDHYEAEHSNDGIHFETVSKAIAFNNGNQQNNYKAIDKNPSAGKNFYRIKSVDKDGTVHYTSIVSLVIGVGKIFISVIPNPVQNKSINLQLNNIPAGIYILILYNTAGQRIYAGNIVHAGGSSSQGITLSSQIKTGTYILQLQNQNNHYTQKIIIE